VILTGGYDSTVEELHLTNGAAALAHGHNVLAVDGPGQGGLLIQQQLTLRPDWEDVISPVVDYALTRADVDPRRIALIGPSLGAPRSTCRERRGPVRCLHRGLRSGGPSRGIPAPPARAACHQRQAR
jgi:hypothetical protein